MTPEQINKEITTFCNRMSEHVDSIRIIVTHPEMGNTACQSYGEGNWYAQVGSVNEWLESAKNGDLAREISQAICREDNNE